MSSQSGRWYARWWAIALLLVTIIGATGLLTVRALGLRSVSPEADPLPLPPEGFDYEWWNGALARWAHEDGVDYEAVLAEQRALRRFVATLGTTGPRSAPERFATESERLAYYLNAYNALVLFAVIDNWPITSVHDVRGWLDPRAGFGFFYGLSFPFDGGMINLYELENSVIRSFVDARIHAALNCASRSCPALAPHAFDPAELDAQLDEVTRPFCSSAPHVVVDDEAEEVRLSAIFDWYRPDFEEHARRFGRPPTLLDFCAELAWPATAEALERAIRSGYEVVFVPYDWSLNQHRGG